MKIVIFLPDFRKGGAQAMMINLANHWASQNHDILIVAGSRAGGLDERVAGAVNIVTGPGGGALSGLLPLRKVLKDRQPDILISALYHANIVAVLASLFIIKKPRIILTERNYLSSSLGELPPVKRSLFKILVSLLYKRADRIVGISKGVCSDLIENHRLPPHMIGHIYNPVIAEDADTKLQETAVHKWFQDKDRPVFIAAGRLVPQKDYPTMLRAFQDFIKHTPARLIILGTGHLEGTIRDLRDALGLNDHVDFTGQVGNPLSYFKQADAFILSSAWEGFGNVVVEALYAGLTVISTDCKSGPAEILEDGRYGYLSPVGDFKSLSENMRRAMTHPLDPQIQKQRAMEFSVPKIAAQYEDAMKGATA